LYRYRPGIIGVYYDTNAVHYFIFCNNFAADDLSAQG